MFTDYDVIVVGSGCAGLAASLYTARAGFETLVLEKENVGGELVSRQMIENYPGFPEGVMGPDLAGNMLKQCENFGVEFQNGEVVSIKDKGSYKIVKTEDDQFTCKGIVLACGSVPKKLECPGEAELDGKGVFYCATCDGAACAGKSVAVAGGGDSGLTEALYLTRLGCKVTVLVSRDKARASQVLVDRAEEDENIELLYSSRACGITGSDWVDGVEVLDRVSGETKHLDVEGIFIRIGQKPNSEFLSGIIELAETGQVPVDENMKTAIDGIYACGDLREKSPMQVSTGVGDGVIAATNLIRYLNTLEG